MTKPCLAMRHVACELEFAVAETAVLALQIAVAKTAGELVDERFEVAQDGVTVAHAGHEVPTATGGRIHIVHTTGKTVRISYAASVRPRVVESRVSDDGSPGGVTSFDEESILALRQSRYCPSDALAGFAAVEFAGLERGPDLGRAVATWVFERFAYQAGSSGPLDTAVDTLVANAGVCRDFAHVTIALCRALGVPARLVAVYAPGLSPMDFHAVVEVRVGERWLLLDPTRLAPRSSLLRIATGRDAADTALATTLHGDVRLLSTKITAIVDGDLPADDHRRPVALA